VLSVQSPGTYNTACGGDINEPQHIGAQNFTNSGIKNSTRAPSLSISCNPPPLPPALD
jgi:hypothetical protein